ncbi:SRPBCC family protein [Streptomyces sp. NPDC005708]|uniref:SRPBCC family protein n=1 Tax=Streptomyces sp. NPDC005708 TaxID=3154564 RepID=UPI0033D6FC0C
MEYEVFVPVPAERLSEALADPARLARGIPGLQRDADTGRVAGRLKVRVAGHTITYRGALRVTGQDDGSYAVEAEATEARGTGTVKLSLTVRLLPTEGGTTVAFSGTAAADGRITELPGDAVASAGARLLGRFAEGLAAEQADTAAESAGGKETDGPSEKPVAGGPQDTAGQAPAGKPEAASRETPPASQDTPEAAVEPPAVAPSVHDAEIPPSSLDPFADEDDFVDEDEPEEGLVVDGFDVEGEPPAEAAHARRTMIGRSAEEVDHAPPRGRYAPVPAPEAMSAGTTLRWAAPAAALIVASAIVAGRMLRRRR